MNQRLGATLDGQISDHADGGVAEISSAVVDPVRRRSQHHARALVDELAGHRGTNPIGGPGAGHDRDPAREARRRRRSGDQSLNSSAMLSMPA
jgi:hypothetical protein